MKTRRLTMTQALILFLKNQFVGRNGRETSLPVDFAAITKAMGAHSVHANNYAELEAALEAAKHIPGTSVIVIETDNEARVPGYESWWDVPVAEVSAMPSVRKVRTKYEKERDTERVFVATHKNYTRLRDSRGK